MSPRRAAALGGGDRTLREHLIATAERLIGERGTAGLTVRAIARAAGVADGVLYNHFTDKEELLALALHAHVATVERALPPLPEPGAGPLEDGLRAHLEHGIALHDGLLPALVGLLTQPAVITRWAALSTPGPHWRESLSTYLEAERALGRLRPDANVEAATSLIVGFCHAPVLSALLHGEGPTHTPSPTEIKALVTTILKGVGSPKD